MSEIKEEKIKEEKIKNHAPKRATRTEGSMKKKSRKENGLNTINKEKVDNKTDKKIKEDILNIEFDSLLVSNSNFSKYITSQFGIQSDNLIGETLQFFYSEKFETNIVSNSSVFISLIDYRNPRANYLVDKYIINHKKKLRDALNINKIMKGFSFNLSVLDGVNDVDTLVTMPRYQKMKRLEGLYETLIRIGLTLIHNFYWEDICNNITSIDNSLEESIKLATPIIINLKHKFEDIVKSEYEYSDDEEKIIMLNRKY